MLAAVSLTKPRTRAVVCASLHRSSPLSTPRSSIIVQKSHQVNTLRPSHHHDKMVNAVVQGMKALQYLSRLWSNLLSKCTKGGTKFIKRTGQFAEVFEVNWLCSEAWQVWVGQQGGSELNQLGNEQWVPGKRSVGNASARSNIALLKNTVNAVHHGYDGRVCVQRVQQTGADSNGHWIWFKEGALSGVWVASSFGIGA